MKFLCSKYNAYFGVGFSIGRKTSLAFPVKMNRVCFISVETTVPKVWKMVKVFEKTFGTFHPSTHLKHTQMNILMIVCDFFVKDYD